MKTRNELLHLFPLWREEMHAKNEYIVARNNRMRGCQNICQEVKTDGNWILLTNSRRGKPNPGICARPLIGNTWNLATSLSLWCHGLKMTQTLPPSEVLSGTRFSSVQIESTPNSNYFAKLSGVRASTKWRDRNLDSHGVAYKMQRKRSNDLSSRERGTGNWKDKSNLCLL